MPAPSATDAAGPMIQYDSVVVTNESTSSAAGSGSAVHATSVTRGARAQCDEPRHACEQRRVDDEAHGRDVAEMREGERTCWRV